MGGTNQPWSLESTPRHVLSHETIQTVRLLFIADDHWPLLSYSSDGNEATIRCMYCNAAIRWSMQGTTWSPDTSGHEAGVCCPLHKAG